MEKLKETVLRVSKEVNDRRYIRLVYYHFNRFRNRIIDFYFVSIAQFPVCADKMKDPLLLQLFVKT